MSDITTLIAELRAAVNRFAKAVDEHRRQQEPFIPNSVLLGEAGIERDNSGDELCSFMVAHGLPLLDELERLQAENAEQDRELGNLQEAFHVARSKWPEGYKLVSPEELQRLEGFESRCRRLEDALKDIAAPDMWEQVEGMVFGPDCPDGHSDPLIWLGADHPSDIARSALEAP